MKRSDWLNNNLKPGSKVSKSGKYAGPKKTVDFETGDFLEDVSWGESDTRLDIATARRNNVQLEFIRAEAARRQRMLAAERSASSWGRERAEPIPEPTENEVLRERYLEAMRNSNGPFDRPEPRFTSVRSRVR